MKEQMSLESQKKKVEKELISQVGMNRLKNLRKECEQDFQMFLENRYSPQFVATEMLIGYQKI